MLFSLYWFQRSAGTVKLSSICDFNYVAGLCVWPRPRSETPERCDTLSGSADPLNMDLRFILPWPPF